MVKGVMAVGYSRECWWAGGQYMFVMVGICCCGWGSVNDGHRYDHRELTCSSSRQRMATANGDSGSDSRWRLGTE